MFSIIGPNVANISLTLLTNTTTATPWATRAPSGATLRHHELNCQHGAERTSPTFPSDIMTHRCTAFCTSALLCARMHVARRGVLASSRTSALHGRVVAHASRATWYRTLASLDAPTGTRDACADVSAVANTPAAIDLMRDALRRDGDDADTQVRLARAAFPHELDAFQSDALHALARGRNVVLAAPTGAGKTIVGEMAVYLALMKDANLRVFYCTPLKALSNQKFGDFRRQFGDDRVGLLTGDVTVNRDAPVVVMTTEVYRNMLYGPDATEATDSLFAVVLDEFHYLNQRDRGTVWEESVINSPSHVRLVALSATMANAADVRDWLAAVHGPTALVETSTRPVPLRFAFCGRDGVSPLFAQDQSQSSGSRGFEKPVPRKKKSSLPKLHPKLLRSLQENAALRMQGRERGRDRGRRRSSPSDQISKALTDTKALDKLIRSMRANRGGGRDRFAPVPSYPFVVRSLRRRDMLPCIVFIFSRAGCDAAARAAAEERDSLVNDVERAELAQRLNAFVEQHPDLVQPDRIRLAMQGISSHHAGLLPIWKLCVEELFQDGLIKVVFATETLAAGINMPARTTVISALSKRAGAEGIVSLSTSEVLQMAGRAGRRGKDILGHSVIMHSRFEGVLDAFRVVTSDVDALTSRFTPNYGMVLNLLQTRSLDDSKSLVERSFGNFLRIKRSKERTEAVDKLGDVQIEMERQRAALEQVFKECEDIVAAQDPAELRSYNRFRERVKAEKRALVYLASQAKQRDTELIEDTLSFAPPGTRLLLRDPRPTVASKSEKRSKKRQNFKEAMAAAAVGAGHEGLSSFYLGDIDDEGIEDDIDDVLDQDGKTCNAVLLDMLADGDSVLPVFAAIDEHGSFRVFNQTHVERMFFNDSDVLNFDVVLPNWRDVPLPEKSEWIQIGNEQYTAEMPIEFNMLAVKSADWHPTKNAETETVITTEQSETDEDAVDPHVHAQQMRVLDAVRMVREHPLHENGVGARALQAKLGTAKIELVLKDQFRGKRKKSRRIRKKKSNESEDSSETEIEEDSSWGDFMSIVSVLQTYGFLDDEYAVTSMGEIGAKIRAENELWAAMVLLHPALEEISPMHLGALLAATQMEGGRSDTYVMQEPSGAVLEAVSALAPQRARLIMLQSEHGVEFSVPLDVDLVGLIEMWASGASWFEVLGSTSLQEGDVCRILRRNLDLLRQIPHLPAVSDELKRNARRAIALLDRFPVTDDITYAVRDNEKLPLVR